MPDEWTMKIYKNGDEEKIVKLLKIVFNGWHTLEYWQWKYKQNADGFFPNLIVLADNKGEFVGHYTIIPARIKIGDEIILGSQSVDTATHPNHRRKGIFEKTAKECYSNASNNGISVTYGFAAVGPSYHGFIKKLDWYHICFLVEMEMPLDVKKALKRHFKDKFIGKFVGLITPLVEFRNNRKTKVKIPSDIIIKQVPAFDNRIDELWKAVSPEYDIIVARDKKFFNWRLKNPDSEYVVFTAEKQGKLIGYSIFKIGTEDIRIVDIMALPGLDEIVSYLISKGIMNFKNKDKDMLRCMLPQENKYFKILRRKGFLKTETEMGFIARLNVEDKSLENKIKSIKNWFVMDLDSDHV